MSEVGSRPDEAVGEVLEVGDLGAALPAGRVGGVSLAGVVSTGLMVLGGVVGFLGFGTPIALMAAWARTTGPPQPVYVVLTIAAIAVGLSFGVVLVGLGVLVGLAERTEGLLGKIESHQRRMADRMLEEAASRLPAGSPRPTTEGMSREQGGRIVTLLEEIRETALLSEAQRRARWEKLVVRRAEGIKVDVERLLRDGRFAEAGGLADELEVRLERGAEAARLRERIERARVEGEAADVMDTRRRVAEFMSVGRWDRAEQLAGELVLKYRNSEAARQLRERVGREHRLVRAEQVRQLQGQIEQAVAARQWGRAFATAEQLLARFGDGPEAQVVREKLQTLRENAEIEARQEMERQIKDLVKRHRYGEAVAVARQVVEKYPDSPQAEVLRGQLPRLEERARQQSG